MWCLDVYHDVEWIKENWGRIKPEIEANMRFQIEPDKQATLQIFGSGEELKHIRIILDVNTQDEVEAFYKHLGKVITSIEVFTSLIKREPFYIRRLPHSTSYVTSYGEYSPDNAPPLSMRLAYQPRPMDYEALKQCLGLQFPGLEPYLFFFQKGIDTNLEIDYRWLNYYKICELRYKRGGKELDHESAWRAFLEHFRADIEPFAVDKTQEIWAVIEAIRGYAVHSISGRGKINFGNPYEKKGNDSLISSLPIIERIVHKILNELPENKGFKFFQLLTSA